MKIQQEQTSQDCSRRGPSVLGLRKRRPPPSSRSADSCLSICLWNQKSTFCSWCHLLLLPGRRFCESSPHLQSQNASSEVAIVRNRCPALAPLVTKEGNSSVSCERAESSAPPTLFMERGLKFTHVTALQLKTYFPTKVLFYNSRWDGCLCHP